MSRRNLNLQTPGEAAQTESQTTAIQTPGEAGASDAGASADEAQKADARALLAAQDELKIANQRIQELEAEAAVRTASAKAPTPSSTKPAGQRDYCRTPSAEIDATKLTAPVLSADGWVTPNPPEKKA
ncbi:hypothetical protein [Achromobacter sp. 2789STDY5608628]|uniref:hypothetical protein n=1 Tax=Achromobacter sp. 2789STDY5608628 TaxID=1806493 RepID=UPI0006C23081|nr:hypothetical protein [Achromobacter sp. 2789STDY5608628]CUJ67570.1 Uncharacterised protein [Achromobacter sp. 2789STDY5608628]